MPNTDKIIRLEQLERFKNNLADVAISGSYNDLSDVPVWVGTRAEYEQALQDGELPNNGLIGIIDENDVMILYSRVNGAETEIGGFNVDIATVEKVGIVRPDNETIFIKEDGTIYTHVWAGTLDRYYAIRDKLPNDTAIIIIDYDGMPDDDYYVNGVKIVSWSKGSDQEIVNMIDGARAGKINLYDYWTVGDERTVHLSSISANPNGAFTTAMSEQDVVWVIGDLTTPGHPAYPNQTVGAKLPYLVWVQKDCLNQKARMYSSNTSEHGWVGSLLRADLNELYYNSLPSILRNALISFETTTAKGDGEGGSTANVCIDKVAVPAEKEIYGLTNFSDEVEDVLEQIADYRYDDTWIKKDSNGEPCDFWTRSPYLVYGAHYIIGQANGHASVDQASKLKGVAPFGCM